MTRRNKLIIILAVVIFVFGIVLVALAPRFRQTQTNVNTNGSLPGVNGVPSQATPDATAIGAPTPPPVFTQEPSTQSVLLALAQVFAEKFGSFSNHANFQNLRDLEPLMTEDMKAWSARYMAENPNKPNDQFYGVTTRALKAELVSINPEETEAQVVVTTQQAESRGTSGSPGISYAKLSISFKKIGTQWLVNSAVWQ
jgi:hypothetical protein